METINNKRRTPSLCRQWEKNRRNKFNDAISRLGETVKEINMAFDSSCSDDSTQYPKIGIIEKAIVCLQRCSKEKTQLKADLLALQVKIEGFLEKKNMKDASTQVIINFKRDKKNSKLMNIVMVKDKVKRKALKEKAALTTNVIDKRNASTKECSRSIQRSLPLILPKISSEDKKGAENTIVVLPAAPYILPQRPLLLPTMPPTFVLVDSNLQTLNKSSFPVTNRTNGDVTKTTMVNILPISAYSRPLSANKSKRCKLKTKIDVTKRSVKKPKQNTTVDKELVSSELANISKVANVSDVSVSDQNNKNIKVGVDNNNSIEGKDTCDVLKKSENVAINHSNTAVSKSENMHSDQNQTDAKAIDSQKQQLKEHGPSKESTKTSKNSICANTDLFEKTASISDSSALQPKAKTDEETNQPKIVTPKQILPEDKENKLPAILDVALCENNVDGGNARLELAEEFLAASPTAAFLMSFPLVSGNRADSPAEETQSSIQIKDNNRKRNDAASVPQIIPYFEKPNDQKNKSTSKTNIISNKPTDQPKYATDVVSKTNSKASNVSVITSNVCTENPFLNLPMTSLISTSGTLTDATYLDFDCNIGKTAATQSTTYLNNSNLFYKGDPFNTVKSSIYSTSNISSGHEFNSFGLYPCAMEKYASKNKSDFLNVEDNLMKIGSSRLMTYDIDLGWSHKGFDFVASTSAPNTFNKDNVLTTSSGSYTSSYNPFNSEFHLPLTSTPHKRNNNTTTKTSSSFADTITSFYSQPANLWNEDVPFYTNSNITKNISSKQQNYFPIDHTQPTNIKPNNSKQYDNKLPPQVREENLTKTVNAQISAHQIPEKYTKKSPSKMHINWMTSEIRPMQSNYSLPHTELKGTHKSASVYGQVEQISKKQDYNDGSYFPISMSNFQQTASNEELHTWPSTRQAGTTEISIEPPPINLPTLVGDLALGPHDKKKTTDSATRGATQADLQHCSNLFSVTQLMNRSSENNVTSRYHGLNIDTSKSIPTKHNFTQAPSENNRKSMSRLEHHLPEPCYIYNDSKTVNAYENNMNTYTQGKSKLNKSDKNSKAQKHSYSAEALIRGGSCTQKLQDSARFIGSTQKYNDYNMPQDNSVAQVSHFPPLLDYSDNSYTGQQYSGTTLYNSTTNTITNSFYTNFIPGSSNIMPSNYGNGPFSSDFMDYNQTAECGGYNHKYEELKIRNNPSMFQQDKVPSNYKSSRRESAAKHKLECSKKESSKKYQSKRAKLNADVDEWSDPNLQWQNKAPAKRHSNLVSEDLPFPNYGGNQMAGQYQPELYNGPVAPAANAQGVAVGHNSDRSLGNFAATSRANFNLSTIFPEITMKVQ